MNYTTKSAFAIAFVIASFLFMAFGGDTWTGAMTAYRSMGGYGSKGGITGVWLLAPLLIVLSLAFLWAAFEEEVGASKRVATGEGDAFERLGATGATGSSVRMQAYGIQGEQGKTGSGTIVVARVPSR